MRRSLLHCVVTFFCIGLVGLAQNAGEPNEGSRITYDRTNDVFAFSWWGRAGKAYFIQVTDDLLASWKYLPEVKAGADETISMLFTPTSDKFFLRLEIVADPFGMHRDNDGMSDGYEILSGLDPFSVDGTLDRDGDGIINQEDARPNDASVGRLNVTILHPVDGALIP